MKGHFTFSPASQGVQIQPSIADGEQELFPAAVLHHAFQHGNWMVGEPRVHQGKSHSDVLHKWQLQLSDSGQWDLLFFVIYHINTS